MLPKAPDDKTRPEARFSKRNWQFYGTKILRMTQTKQKLRLFKCDTFLGSFFVQLLSYFLEQNGFKNSNGKKPRTFLKNITSVELIIKAKGYSNCTFGKTGMKFIEFTTKVSKFPNFLYFLRI